MADTLLNIQLIYSASADTIFDIRISVPQGTSVEEALRQSELPQDAIAVCLEQGRLGIYGEKVENSHILCEGDRIECYRPITADPKQVRQRNVAKRLRKPKNRK